MLEKNKMASPAVLFLIFNRIDSTRQVFKAIRQARPSRLYLAADGPRSSKEGEDKKVKAVREYVLKHIDWDCEVKTLFRENNLGCKMAVSGAIDWFFDNEEMGIILEDDTVPDPSFFAFCANMLEKYCNDDRVMHISGVNFQDGVKRGDGSYYFSGFSHVWGWATWRRAWKNYDVTMKELPALLHLGLFDDKAFSNVTKQYLKKVFTKTYENMIDTWDYQWHFAILKMNGICITPNQNLVTNVGFGDDATHTKNANSMVSYLKTQSMELIQHPSGMDLNIEADLCTSEKFFAGPIRKLLYRVKDALKKGSR